MSESAAYCPECKREVPRSEVGEGSLNIGEHLECGGDLYLSERLVVDIIFGIKERDGDE